MKVGFVRRGYSPTGGAEAYLLRLADGVAARGHTPVLLTSKEWPADRWPNEYIVRINGRSPLQFSKGIQRAATGCDVVFSLERIAACDVYRAGDGVHRAWLERRAKFEPAWKRWTRWTNGKHRELLELEAEMFARRAARFVIANSRMVRDEIVAHYGYPAGNIEVIPNGYDSPLVAENLRAARRAELGLADGDFVALFAGSGWERKGLETAIAAVKGMRGVKMLVAGKGRPPREVPVGVTFLGPQSNLQPDFAAADVFVLPTIYDPFSNACLEALAAGLPVLTTSANGFSEIISNGEHGTVFEPGDAGALRQALEFWRERAAEARSRCRELASRYSVAENTRRTLEVISRAVR